MIVDTVLTNAKAYINKSIVDCNIAIEQDKIFKIGKETQMPDADEKVSLKGLLALPGLIDSHVHLRDEGRAYKEDFLSGTSAAIVGGFTTVLDMPNNDPVTMNSERLKNRMEIAKRKILANVGFYSEFPKVLEQMKDIVAQGAIGFKLFMGCQTGGLNIDNDIAIEQAFMKAGELGAPIAVHAEDKALLHFNEEKLKMKNSPAAFLEAHSEEVEHKAIARLLKLNKNMHLHFCHVTSKMGLDLVVEAKKAGRAVSCEVTPNHLLLSSAEVQNQGQMLIIAPPLRERSHVEALWKGLTDGYVDTLGSDHAPHTMEEKMASRIWDVKVGMPSLETTLPLILTLIKKNRLSLNRAVELLAERPAKIFGLNNLGKLEAGYAANLTIVDLKWTGRIDASKFRSKAKFSPYNDWEVQGKAAKTIVNGVLVMDDGEIFAKAGTGQVIGRGPQ